MATEPNNLISEATDSGVSSAENQSVTFSGRIDTVSDIDLYGFELNEGEGITLDIDTVNAPNNTANFDSYLRVFDADGQELAFNDDYSLDSEEFSLDSYIGFIANSTGEYYVGVSSFANQNYDPVDGDNVNQSRATFIAGDYDLTLDIVEVVADDDPDNTIAEATNTEIGEIRDTVIDAEIETEADVDFYRFELGQGEGIEIDVLADNSELDSYLRLFDADGNELAFNDNSDDPDNITNDSAIAFAPEPGEYYVGVSSAGNYDYDEINGDTNLNFSPNTGISTGNYQLGLEVVEVVVDEDSDNTIAQAVDSDVSSSSDSTVFSGAIDGEFDVDFSDFQLAAGEGIDLNINAEDLNADLDSFLRVFDSQDNELAVDNNNDANFTGEFNADSNLTFIAEDFGTDSLLDSVLQIFDRDGDLLASNDEGSASNEDSNLDFDLNFTADTNADYYIGGSNYSTFDDDLINGSNNFGNSFGSTTDSYNLAIDLTESV